jgi:hypothetical protein
MIEEFIPSNQLYIINEESPRRTFQSTRGESNIDLTIVNNYMLADIAGCEIAEVESASYHNILKFSTSLEADKLNKVNTPELKYIIKEKQRTAFYTKLFYTFSKNFQIEITGGSAAYIDRKYTQD